ncbi:MAG: tRNA lysidine(34) synthetase TilS [Bacteroidales bacterium]
MYESFIKTIRRHLPVTTRRIMLAVSGGVDSVVMTHLFMQTDLKCGIAHCNFMLREKEADEDEFFVKTLASMYGVPFFSEHFETRQYAGENRLSVQMAARQLRYAWFEQLCRENRYDLVALAHNRSDQVETLLINLARGTGIRGMTGMKVLQGNLFRPLLFAGRKEILQYARNHNLSFREDSSNQETYYTRNRIRHYIIPEFTEMNPRFEETMVENIERFTETEELFLYSLEIIRKRLLVQQGDRSMIKLDELMKTPATRTVLHELLKEFHFSPAQADDVFHALSSSPGKQFHSHTHRLIKDREALILVPRQEEDEEQEMYYIEEGTGTLEEPIRISFRTLENTPGYTIPSDPDIACVDRDLITFPLILRKWKKGDYFYPFGMNALKKLSDFFIDRKYSLVDKEKTWILAMGDRIIWIVGDRIDHRFRITGETKRILEITCHRFES